MAEQFDIEYWTYLLIWLIAPIATFMLTSQRGRLPGMLLYAYIIGFFMNHWLGALVHASPWQRFLDSNDTVVGFKLSTYGLLALLAGALLLPGGQTTRIASVRFGVPAVSAESLASLQRAARLNIAFGAVFWAIGFTPLAALPSMASLLTAGRQCLLLGICLLTWAAWQRGSTLMFRRWMILSLALPVVTVVTQGFIGYGISMLANILAFTAMYYRPKWHLLGGLLVAIYCGMSFWVAYANHRNSIREAVWGEQSYSARFNALAEMMASIEPFDLSNENHLEMIDLRLNQNVLVGQAVRTTPDLVPYEDGATIYSALLSVIPRAIWPDKPIVGGSGNFVANHTMQKFGEGTSVGMGQILEFYINFGIPAVLIGCFAFGLMFRYFDIRLAEAVAKGEIASLQYFFLVGCAALQPLGALSEIVASMAGGAVMSTLIMYVAIRQRRAMLERAPAQTGTRHRP